MVVVGEVGVVAGGVRVGIDANGIGPGTSEGDGSGPDVDARAAVQSASGNAVDDDAGAREAQGLGDGQAELRSVAGQAGHRVVGQVVAVRIGRRLQDVGIGIVQVA